MTTDIPQPSSKSRKLYAKQTATPAMQPITRVSSGGNLGSRGGFATTGFAGNAVRSANFQNANVTTNEDIDLETDSQGTGALFMYYTILYTHCAQSHVNLITNI